MHWPFQKLIVTPPLWRDLRAVGSSNIVKSTILIPFFGYMIMFNSHLEGYFDLSNLFVWEADQAASYRLFFLYFGLSSMGLASLIFQICCPGPIKLNIDIVTYVDREYKVISKYRLRMLVGMITQAYEHIRSSRQWLSPYMAEAADSVIVSSADERENGKEFELEALKVQRNSMNISSPIARRLIAILYMIGFFLLSIPTVDTFVRVSPAFGSAMLGV
jgi:hypothetical protein